MTRLYEIAAPQIQSSVDDLLARNVPPETIVTALLYALLRLYHWHIADTWQQGSTLLAHRLVRFITERLHTTHLADALRTNKLDAPWTTLWDETRH